MNIAGGSSITQDDVVYLIVTDRFADGDPANNGPIDRSDPDKRHGGDLLGIVQRLPYLQALGVTALWISPVYLNPPDAYHGYHPLSFEQIDPHLYSPELGPEGRVPGPAGYPDLMAVAGAPVRRFVEIAHAHGLKVMLDVVINHTAPGHPWLQERPDWFNLDRPTAEKMWLWGLPDLNHDNIDVNVYFVLNVLEWMFTTGVDGVRIDAARHVETEFWSMFKLYAKGLFPGVTLIGEVFDGSVGQVAPFQAYHGFDSMFDFPLYMATVDVFAYDQGFGRIARPELSDDEPPGILNQDKAYRDAYHLITFLGNHDTTRFFHLAGGPERREEATLRTKLALTFLFTTRGIPQLYYGDELAMEGGPHPDNRRDMPWDLIDGPGAEAPAGQQAQAMQAFTRQLIELRRGSMALRYGLLVTLYLTPTLYAFARLFVEDFRVVVLNNAWEAIDVAIPLTTNPRIPTPARRRLPNGLRWMNDLNCAEGTEIVDGSMRVRLPGKTGAIFRPASPLPPHAWGSS
jgi:alpha-amylase